MYVLCNDVFVFQSHELTLDTDHPDLTRCFQDTVLTWVPSAYMLLSASVKLSLYLWRGIKCTSWSKKSLLHSAKLVHLHLFATDDG